LNVLFITTRFPFPPVRGDKCLPYYRMQYLSKLHRISLLSFVEDDSELEYVRELTPFCAEIQTVRLPLWRSRVQMALNAWSGVPAQVSYYSSQEYRVRLNDWVARERFDIIQCVLSRGANYVLGMETQAAVVVDMIDALSLNMARRAEAERGLKATLFRREAYRMRQFERQVCSSVDRVLVVSELDRLHLQAPNVSVIPSGVDMETRSWQPGNKTVVLTGNFNYYPNRDAVVFFMTKVFPLLRRAVPDVRFKVVGLDPPAEFFRLAAGDSAIEITGFVPDVKEHILAAGVAVCPLRTGGAGMHMKAMEAMTCGVPIVASPLVTGFAAEPGRHLLRATTPDEYVNAICSIFGDPILATQLSKSGKELVATLSWEQTTMQLESLYQDLVAGIEGKLRETGSLHLVSSS
jgi:glycosyltransferase involved in cell wall biosynthesis